MLGKLGRHALKADAHVQTLKEGEREEGRGRGMDECCVNGL